MLKKTLYSNGSFTVLYFVDIAVRK